MFPQYTRCAWRMARAARAMFLGGAAIGRVSHHARSGRAPEAGSSEQGHARVPARTGGDAGGAERRPLPRQRRARRLGAVALRAGIVRDVTRPRGR